LTASFNLQFANVVSVTEDHGIVFDFADHPGARHRVAGLEKVRLAVNQDQGEVRRTTDNAA
jgi:hypothetical protein